MGDNHSNGGSGDTPESLAAEREEMEEAVAGLRQMERAFETLTEQAKLFDPDLVAFCVKLKGSEMKRCIWKGFFTPEGFQWHKPAMAIEKALLDQLHEDLAAYCEALVRWAEELEEREQAHRSKAVQQSVRDPVENVEPAENPVEAAAGWIWNQGGIKATAGIITDAVADVGSGTIYGLSRASDYATNLLSFNDPLEVLTHEVPMSETSEAAAKEMDPAAKAGWYNPSEPGNNAAKTLLNVGSVLIDPENAGNLASNEVRVTGEWRVVGESMPDSARAYQLQITGRTGMAYVVNGVKFDGVTSKALIETKGPGYSAFLDQGGNWKPWFTGAAGMLKQATNQIAVAGGRPVIWYVAEADAAAAIQKLLGDTGVRVVFTPPAR